MGYLIRNLNEIVTYEKNAAEVYRYLTKHHADKVKSKRTLETKLRSGFYEIDGLTIEKSDEIPTRENNEIKKSIIEEYQNKKQIIFKKNFILNDISKNDIMKYIINEIKKLEINLQKAYFTVVLKNESDQNIGTKVLQFNALVDALIKKKNEA